MQLSGEGARIRFLRSIFVPEDETCFLLFEGERTESVRQVMTRAGLAVGTFVRTASAGEQDE